MPFSTVEEMWVYEANAGGYPQTAGRHQARLVRSPRARTAWSFTIQAVHSLNLLAAGVTPSLTRAQVTQE